MKTLQTLFGSSLRVQLLRTFLGNDANAYDIGQLEHKTGAKKTDIMAQLRQLEKAGIIKSKSAVRTITTMVKKTVKVAAPVKKSALKKTSVTTTKKATKQKPAVTTKVISVPKEVTKKVPVWSTELSCPQVPALRVLVLESDMIKNKDVAKHLSKTGAIKLLVLSGIFVKNSNDKVDIVVVGDKLDESQFTKTIERLESEVGKELRYSLFSPEEFAYRMNMFDKYLTDVFAAPHEKMIHKIDIPQP